MRPCLKREPRILYLSVSGFGQTGPLSGRPAMDPVLQAFTGLMLDNKGEDGIPHRVPFIVIDMSTALYAFQALSAALYARRDQPRGRRIEVSLLQAASAMQVIRMMMVYLEGEQIRRAMPSGVFKTADGWLQFLVIRNDAWVKFCRIVLGTPAAGDRSALRRRGGPHDQRGAAAGHRAAGNRREAHRLLVGAPARGRHHARAAEHLPRIPAPSAGGGDRPDQLARRRRRARAPPGAERGGNGAAREGHAARHAAPPRPAHGRGAARPRLRGRPTSPRSSSARSSRKCRAGVSVRDTPCAMPEACLRA